MNVHRTFCGKRVVFIFKVKTLMVADWRMCPVAVEVLNLSTKPKRAKKPNRASLPPILLSCKNRCLLNSLAAGVCKKKHIFGKSGEWERREHERWESETRRGGCIIYQRCHNVESRTQAWPREEIDALRSDQGEKRKVKKNGKNAEKN